MGSLDVITGFLEAGAKRRAAAAATESQKLKDNIAKRQIALREAEAKAKEQEREQKKADLQRFMATLAKGGPVSDRVESLKDTPLGAGSDPLNPPATDKEKALALAPLDPKAAMQFGQPGKPLILSGGPGAPARAIDRSGREIGRGLPGVPKPKNISAREEAIIRFLEGRGTNLDKQFLKITPNDLKKGLDLKSDIGRLLLKRQELLLQKDITINSPEVKRIDEIIKAVQEKNPPGFRDQIFEYYKEQIGGGSVTPAVIEAFVKAERLLSSERSAGRESGKITELGKPETQRTLQDVSEAKATGTTRGGPVPPSLVKPFAVMDQTLDIIGELKTNFTPEELARFVGPIDFPGRGVAQAILNDPKFAAFQVTAKKLKLLAFGEGGKQLTPFEAEVVFGTIPTGTEFSVTDFIAKISEIERRVPLLKNSMIRIATGTRGELRKTITEPTTSKLSPAGQKLLDKLKKKK